MTRLFFLLLALLCSGQTLSKVWVADQGDGTYKNPVLHADYSDPDVVRVGADFYLTASSFNAVPGLPILHSTDLVNWELTGHVFAAQPPLDVFARPRHGGGVWAPSIRYHNGTFFIFYPDPDIGIYMVKAKNASGPWSAPLLVKAAKGWIDPCPLWDTDGKAYLVSAMAASRSGIKSVLVVSRMDVDGTKLLDDGVMVFDGHAQDPTVEGPKLYKRNGYYYIFAPALGALRLFAIPMPEGVKNFWDVPNLLLQKFPAPEFTATAKLNLTTHDDQDQVGLIVMGLDYARLCANKTQISLSVAKNADRGTAESTVASAPVSSHTSTQPFYLRVKVAQNAICMFSYSSDGENFTPIGDTFTARPGRWIGAKVGFFAVRQSRSPEYGYADVDWFRIAK